MVFDPTDFDPPAAAGRWQTLTTKTVYDNPWMRVQQHDVRNPNGGPGVYGVMRPKSLAVGVVPIDDQGRVVLVGQPRFACGDYSWEVPEGGAPFDEDPQQGAARELREETGLEAQYWQDILHLQLSNSLTDERAVCFLAWGLSTGTAAPDLTEQITVMRRPFAHVLEAISRGLIQDAMTVAMVLRVHQMVVAGDVPPDVAGLIKRSL